MNVNRLSTFYLRRMIDPTESRAPPIHLEVFMLSALFPLCARSPMARTISQIVGMSTLLALIACGGQSVTSPVNVTGTYVLRSINGQALPGSLSRDAARTIEVVGGDLSITAEGSFNGRSVIRETVRGNPPVTREEIAAGRYTVSDSTLRLTNTATASTTAVDVRGDILRYISDLGNVYEWQRVFVAGGSP